MSMTARDRIWFGVNARIWLFFVLVFTLIWVPKTCQVWHLNIDLRAPIGAFIGLLFSRFIAGISDQLKHFTPENALEAKRLNEQIKSFSTAINAAAGAAISVFAFAQIARDLNHPDWGMLIGALALGFYVHTGARSLLGLLKDES